MNGDTAAVRAVAVPQEWKRSELAIDIPQWTECGTCALPDPSFPPKLKMEHIASVIDEYRRCMSQEQATFRICAACSRKEFANETLVLPLKTFIEHFSEWCALKKNKAAQDEIGYAAYAGLPVPRELHGLLIDPKGVLNRGTEIAICGHCARSMKRNVCPPLVLANGTWTGDTPIELEDLSLAEELLLCRTYRHGIIITLHGSNCHAFTGNAMAFPVNVGSTMETQFPRLPEKLADIIVVNYYTKLKDAESARVSLPMSAKKMLTVRRSKIVAAFKWLNVHNWQYSGCTLVENLISQIPEDEVPPSFWNRAFCALDPAVNGDVERSGYADTAPTQDVGCTPQSSMEDHGISSCSSFDARQSGVETDSIRKQALNDMITPLLRSANPKTGESDALSKLAVGINREKGVNEFRLLSLLLAQCYPTLFPYGVGVPGTYAGESDASAFAGTGVTFEEHVSLLLQSSNPRFQAHRMFLFHVLNMENRKLALRSAKQVSKHADIKLLGRELAKVDVNALRNVGDATLSNVSFSEAIGSLPTGVQKLLQKIKLVTRNLSGGYGSSGKMLHEITALMHVWGAATLFVTINPHDLTNPVLLHWISEQGCLDDPVPMKRKSTI